MRLARHGFSLFGMLVALALSGLILTLSSRLLLDLQRAVLGEYQAAIARDSLWQLALDVGKHLQRAGYCRTDYQWPPLTLGRQGRCIIVQWQKPDGQPDEFERLGYRFHQGTLQRLKDAPDCEGAGWEKVTDPQQLRLTDFSVTRRFRHHARPLLIIQLVASLAHRQRLIEVRHVVVGENQ